MVVLDNLVVSVALPTIHRDLGASIQSLEWTVNAYVLAYAVLLLTGAALGDRFGRKRMFLLGLAVFTGASAAAALAPQHRPADRRARRAGRRRGDRHAAHAHAARRGLPRRAPRHRDRRVVGHLRHRRRARAARRRRRRAGHLLALDLLDQRADRPAARAARRALAGREPRPLRQARPARPRARLQPALFGIVFGLVRAQSLGWTSATVLASLDRRRRCCSPRFVALGAARARADAADVASSPSARSPSPTWPR